MSDRARLLQANSVIYVAGHRGMVGSAIVRALKKKGITNIITNTHAELDLCEQDAVQAFLLKEKPDYVVLAAAKVGGIYANNAYPAEFIYDNLMIQANIINAAYRAGVNRMLFLGSSCIYPKFVSQPIKEESLFTGVLESTNEPYALAKIVGIKLCESYNRQYDTCYRSIMPTNLYGMGDNFHAENSHVVPALIRKFHEAKCNNDPEVEVWGSGTVRREFLHVDDMADACIHVMNLPDSIYAENTKPMLSHINVGTGKDVTIRQLAEIIKHITDYQGNICFNTDKPEGAPRKLLDVSRLNALGWSSRIKLKEGLSSTFKWFLQNSDDIRS